jgi:hypothetical protein
VNKNLEENGETRAILGPAFLPDRDISLKAVTHIAQHCSSATIHLRFGIVTD